MGAVADKGYSVSVYVTGCVCVSLRRMCSASPLVEPANRKVAAASSGLVRVRGSTGWALAADQEVLGLQQLKEAAAPNAL